MWSYIVLTSMINMIKDFKRYGFFIPEDNDPFGEIIESWGRIIFIALFELIVLFPIAIIVDMTPIGVILITTLIFIKGGKWRYIMTEILLMVCMLVFFLVPSIFWKIASVIMFIAIVREIGKEE